MQDKSAAPVMPIGTVERETGLAKDTLRVWERRYGFPKPLRDQNGDRVYPLQQVERLRGIKRLVDNGFRPGKVIAGSLVNVPALSQRGAEPLPALDAPVAQLLALLKRPAHRGLKAAFAQQLQALGLARFILERIAPMNALVGSSWACAELGIHSEHLYCDLAHDTLHVALDGVSATQPPRVLLTTLPGETHSLGLLMARCMLTLEAAETIALGVQTPIEDIAQASQSHAADIVALSVSGAFATPRLHNALALLRERLPASTPLWIGGEGARRARVRLRGVSTIASLEEIASAVAAWRTECAPRPSAAPRNEHKGPR